LPLRVVWAERIRRMDAEGSPEHLAPPSCNQPVNCKQKKT
jgi:hypothetical protein